MKKPKAYMVATAHLDTVWNWTLENTVKEYLRATLDRNFALLEKYPHYRFNFEGAYRYELIREYYPEDFERIRQYAAEGRWCVTGSSWENGDVVTPAPETLMRNILYGNRYFETHFGKRSNDIFLPDCFGFPVTLPSIMRHMGLTAFSSQKLTWNIGEAGYRVPFDVGIWQGIDGSEVIASLDPGPYVTRLTERPGFSRELLDRISSLPARKDMRYYGTGDQGGAPDDASVRFVEESVCDPDAPVETVSAYAGQLADELTEEDRELLPRTSDELLMVTHGVGSYTSVAPAKRFHRSNETKAVYAEEISVFASWLGAREYPKKILTKSWRDFIRHEFHDDLTGTSVLRAYRETFHDDIIVNNTLDGEIASSLVSISRNVDTLNGSGRKLVVFNPAAYPRQSIAEVTLPVSGESPENLTVFAPDGREVPSQVIGKGDSGIRLLFHAKVPSMGYAVFRVLPSAKPFGLSALSVSEKHLENEHLSVTIDESGNISSVFDKDCKIELLREPIRYEILWNSFRGYGAWEIGYDDLTAEPR
ncbi:MAG: alpha-mannosidase, partial [Clostridia bacterium]|nr:alpha-mannosidase [Clostridia bacterium]